MTPEEFDLDRSVDQAWALFADRLADVLASMDDSGDLRIDADDPAEHPACPHLSFHADGAGQVKATAAGNPTLSAADRLGDAQIAELLGAGWVESGSAYVMARSQDRADELAAACVVALRDAYGVQHPAFLVPDQLAEILTPSADDRVPERVEAATAYAPRDAADLDALLAAELTRRYGYLPIQDDVGDYAIRVGSTVVFVRATPDAREVIVFSIVVHEVEGRSRAMEVLNDFNAESRFVRFELIRDRVVVQMSLLAQPFVPAHLRQALQLVSDLADGIDGALAIRLHGRTTFVDPEPPRSA